MAAENNTDQFDREVLRLKVTYDNKEVKGRYYQVVIKDIKEDYKVDHLKCPVLTKYFGGCRSNLIHGSMY
jgi:ribosomal protein S3AE